MKLMQPDYRGRRVPDLFTCNDGTPVTSKEIWEQKRRPEILEMFRNQEYGVLPDMSSVKINTRVADSRCDNFTMAAQAVRKTIEVEAVRGNSHFLFDFVLFIPADAKKPSPCFVMLDNRGIDNGDPARAFMSPFWPAEMIVSRGYATAVLHVQDVAPDYDEGFTTRFHRLFPEYAGSKRPDNLCGALSIWSWGASRVMDYLETDPMIDAKHVCIVGHSRGGKTALWTIAQDQRFFMALSSCAGNSGDALARNSTGETIAQITERFPYWFCRNYRKYAHNEEAMPFDQHMLLALAAPRLLYTTSRTFDNWADQKGQFDSVVLASEVYEKLYGIPGIESKIMPKPEHPLQKGTIGYHMKTGAHDLDEYNWDLVMDFADLHGMKG